MSSPRVEGANYQWRIPSETVYNNQSSGADFLRWAKEGKMPA